MTVSRDFVDHVLDLLSAWGGVSPRRMFGGYGLFHGDRMFGLIPDDRLYLKVDDHSRRDFESAGTQPFTYSARMRTITMSYWEAPPELFDDGEQMIHWAQRALEAAMISAKTKAERRGSKPTKRRRVTKN